MQVNGFQSLPDAVKNLDRSRDQALQDQNWELADALKQQMIQAGFNCWN